ncbi:MAG: hypothetical protein AB7U29_10630 [Desulfobulbus sp.]
MISIIVERAPADRTGDDIVDPLLTTEAAALERGRNEIDAQCSDRTIVSVSGPHRRWIQPGSLVEYHGRRSTWSGIITRCAITVNRDGDNFTVDRSLEMERES